MSADGIKRLAIYVVYDKDGIIDDYIPYYLNELCQNISHLVVVCNGKLTDAGRVKLEKFTDDVFVRPNIGFDCGAVKDVLFNLYGWDKVYEYDELLIANDTVYGPLYPFKRVFDEMDKRDVDFWCITWQAEFWGGIRPYISLLNSAGLQSYFIDIRKPMFHSERFRNFWSSRTPESYTFFETCVHYELEFTTYFMAAGYTCAAYTDSSCYSSEKSPDNYNVAFVDPLLSAKDCQFPFVKKKSFIYNPTLKLDVYSDSPPNAMMEYIVKNTRYDVNLIWDNLLRTISASDITENLKICYVLPTDFAKSGLKAKKCGIVISFADKEFAREAEAYISNANADVLTKSVNLSNYEYICYISDENPLPAETRRRSILSMLRSAWENVLASPEYVANVLQTFEENPRLGVLNIPKPYHSRYFSGLGKKQNVINAVWFRTAVIGSSLKKIDLPELARQNGYYSGVVMTAEHCVIRNADLTYMLTQLYGLFQGETTFDELLNVLRLNNIRSFCGKYNTVYLYGAGGMAEGWAKAMTNENVDFDGFVVSDGQQKKPGLMGHKIRYLSEIVNEKDECGLILALNPRNRDAVLPMLEEQGFLHILTLN